MKKRKIFKLWIQNRLFGGMVDTVDLGSISMFRVLVQVQQKI